MCSGRMVGRVPCHVVSPVFAMEHVLVARFCQHLAVREMASRLCRPWMRSRLLAWQLDPNVRCDHALSLLSFAGRPVLAMSRDIIVIWFAS